MEKEFNEVISLLKIESKTNLLVFERGKIKNYSDALEFQYHLTNFYDKVLCEISNTKFNNRYKKIINTTLKFLDDLSSDLEKRR